MYFLLAWGQMVSYSTIFIQSIQRIQYAGSGRVKRQREVTEQQDQVSSPAKRPHPDHKEIDQTSKVHEPEPSPSKPTLEDTPEQGQVDAEREHEQETSTTRPPKENTHTPQSGVPQEPPDKNKTTPKRTMEGTTKEDTQAENKTKKPGPQKKQRNKNKETDKSQPKISYFLKPTYAAEPSQDPQGKTGTLDPNSSSKNNDEHAIKRESKGREGTREGIVITHTLGDNSISCAINNLGAGRDKMTTDSKL